ncbi:trehalose-phosphatase (plasmid) [Sulfitobacter alexandrii]|uniref:Trehalose 6-phosphate phosphatase n=1 Tax=Sulfitobacter alexandrii TaxID=1917485 RepID=A0A1J0WMT0_9RHOB|nr:trehalose-phosphatase [Sulfitobacter alexandrii]APE45610.1 trehalose-phosphatase [Sulfitobacter alexandrii]
MTTAIAKGRVAEASAPPPLVDWRGQAAFIGFEGTLSPLSDHPGDAHLPARERELIEALCNRRDGAVAILSGKALSSLRDIFAGLPVVLSCCHGAEIDIAGDPRLVPGADVEIARCAQAARQMADEEGILFERKAAAIALHHGMKPQIRDRVVAFIDRLANDCAELAPLHGRMVSELTARDYSKGTALYQIINHPGFAGRRPVAVGDDASDETAIRAARRIGGIGLAIGHHETEADHVFASRDDFIRWLRHSLETAG